MGSTTTRTVAEEVARKATTGNAIPQVLFPAMRSTMSNVSRSNLLVKKSLPDKVENYSKRIDTALLGKHTRRLYDQRAAKEASILM
jgi:hypothetical protein